MEHNWSVSAHNEHALQPGDGQRFKLWGCRQMLASWRPCSRIPQVLNLWMQSYQILTALCSWNKELKILGLSQALQHWNYSKDSWSIWELLLQRQTPSLEIFQIWSEIWTSKMVHLEAMNSWKTFLMTGEASTPTSIYEV